MRNNENWECREMQVLHQVKTQCDLYGYHAYLCFNTIIINSRFESWKFEVTNSSLIKLYHGSGPGHAPERYHYQFSGRLTAEQLITYIHQHEIAKYTPEFVNFTIHPISA